MMLKTISKVLLGRVRGSVPPRKAEGSGLRSWSAVPGGLCQGLDPGFATSCVTLAKSWAPMSVQQDSDNASLPEPGDLGEQGIRACLGTWQVLTSDSVSRACQFPHSGGCNLPCVPAWGQKRKPGSPETGKYMFY